MRKLGIIDIADNDINEVSGGQLQRACICRSMINHPKMIFADEPTGALNRSSSEEVMEELSKLNAEGTTIMLVTHDVKVAAKCTRVLYIVDGNIKGEHHLGAYTSCAELRALQLYEEYGARLLVLDILLPGMDGFAVCRKIRESSNTPILIVSARTEKEDKLNGLFSGADDYIEKPYDIDIMIAKIKGIFQRRYALDVIADGDLQLKKGDRAALLRGEELELTTKEFDLLLLSRRH